MQANVSRAPLVFVDQQLHGHAAFAAALSAALPVETPQVPLASTDGAVEQMASMLRAQAGHQRPSAIHLISHGQPGGLWLGGKLYDAAALARDAAAWRAVGEALAPAGELLLYGCEVAQGVAGRHFVQELSRLTGAAVAASARPTGASALGGDAALEVHTGHQDRGAPNPLLSQADFDRAGVLLATLPASITPLSGSWFHTDPLATTSFTGSVASSSEIDTYRFAVESTGTHIFTLSPAPGLDLQFRLYDQTGAALSLVRDLVGAGSAELLSLSLTAGQWVYLSVAGFGSGSGDYVVNLQSAAPAITVVNTAGPAFTGTGLGQLDNAGDIDFFSVTAPAGTSSLNLSLAPSGFNAVLRLYSASGTGLQTINSAGSGGAESLSNFAVTAGSTYYIGVSADNTSDSSGSYALSADFNPDDPGHPPESVTPGSGTRLRLNPFGDDSREAAIVTRSEVDLYRFYATTAGSHVISVADTGVDIMFRVYGADGQPLGGTVDAFGTAGVPATETTTVNLASAGWVYVAVSGYESETGNYTVAVNGPSAAATAVATPGLAYTGSADGSIGQLGEQDYFALTAPAGTSTLTISLAPHGADVAIYDSAGSEITYAQNGFGSTQVNVSAGSSYYVAVHGADATGAYTLGADFNPDDPGDPGDPPASVVPGAQVFTFRPNVNGDAGVGNGIFSRSVTHLYGLRVDNPGSFTFTMQSAGDSQLRVYGSNGQPLTPIVDAQGSGTAETVTLTLPAGFAYIATGLVGSGTGSYTLSVNGPSLAATPVTLAAPEHTASVQASVSTLQGKVWAVTAPAGASSLTWSASASVTGLSGSLTLFGPDGSSPVDSISSLPRSNSNIPVVAGQQYYVQVSNFSNANDALVSFNLDFNPDANSAPTASNTSLNATEDTVLNGTLPAATDANSDPITYALGSAAANGTAVVNANGSYSYTPGANFNGSDSFGYSVSDNHGGSNSYTVNVTVAAVNDAPVVAVPLTSQSATVNSAFSFVVPVGTFTDVDNATLTYSATLAAGGALPGWLSFNPSTRTFSGTPAAGNLGTVNVSVVAGDGALSASSNFALVVNAAPNSAPTSANGSLTLTEDLGWGGTLPSASDPDGDPVTYTLSRAAPNGTAVVQPDGSAQYSPNPDFVGVDSFDFQVSDGRGGSNVYTITVTMTPVNDAPVVAVPLTNQSATANSAFSYTVPAGAFTDVDNTTLTYSATLAAGGALPAWLSFNSATRSFSGTPAAGDVGTLDLSVTASDGSLSASSSFALQTSADDSGDPPASVVPGTGRLLRPDVNGDGRLPQSITSGSDNKLFAVKVDNSGLFTFTTQSAADSMLRVYGSDGLPLTPTINAQSGAANETVSLNLPAGMAYVNVAVVGSGTGSVFLRMDGPTYATQAVSLAQPQSTFNTSLTLLPAQAMFWSFTAPAGATQLSWSGAISSANTFIALYEADGTTTADTQNAGASPVVTPVVGGAQYFIGIQNPSLASTADFNFSLDFNPDPNNAPTAAAASYNFTEDTATGGILPDANDADGDPVTYALSAAATKGTVVVNANGTFSYTPNLNANGSDSFGYRVSDNRGGSNSYNVSLNVAAVNDAPVAANGSASATEDTVFNGTLPAASDVDGDSVSYAQVGNPSNGTAIVNANGSYSYTPALNFAGSDTITYRVSDAQGGSNTYTVAVGVANVVDIYNGAGGRDKLLGNAGGDAYNGLAGDDTLVGGGGNDSLNGGDGLDWASWEDRAANEPVVANLGTRQGGVGAEVDAFTSIEGLIGGAGNDRLTGDSLVLNYFFGGAGADTLDGGAEAGDGSRTLDVAVYLGSTSVQANLATGVAIQGDSDVLIGIEAVFGASGDDSLRGADGAANLRGDAFRGTAGNDTLDGGSGVDYAEYLGPRANYTLTRPNVAASAITVTDNVLGDGLNEGSDSTTNIERFVFADQMLAFGTRAEELARVAFVLWTPDIVVSRALFARGLSYYDVGGDFNTMCSVALIFHPEQGLAFAQKLVANMPGTSRTVDGLMALMANAGGGDIGRATAVAAMALDAHTSQVLADRGVLLNGVVADLSVAGFGTLFALLPGPG